MPIRPFLSGRAFDPESSTTCQKRRRPCAHAGPEADGRSRYRLVDRRYPEGIGAFAFGKTAYPALFRSTWTRLISATGTDFRRSIQQTINDGVVVKGREAAAKIFADFVKPHDQGGLARRLSRMQAGRPRARPRPGHHPPPLKEIGSVQVRTSCSAARRCSGFHMGEQIGCDYGMARPSLSDREYDC